MKIKTKDINYLQKLELFNLTTPILTCYKFKTSFLIMLKTEVITVLTKKELIDFIDGKLVLNNSNSEISDVINYSLYDDNIKIDKTKLLEFVG